MSDNHEQDMIHIRELLWEFREGPAVVGMKRDVTVKLLESCIANMEDLNVIEEYAKQLGWHPDMNTTAAIWLSSEAMRAKVDGPVFNNGRMEGRDDVKVMVRKIVDPEDSEHLSLDGVLKKVAELKENFKRAGDEIADLAHPEFGEMGRLQEELHEEKKAHSITRELVTVGIGARLELSDKLELLKNQNEELHKEVEWLRYYKRNVYQCLGPGDDDINMDITKSFVREKGIDALPKAERIRHLEYLDEHKKEG